MSMIILDNITVNCPHCRDNPFYTKWVLRNGRPVLERARCVHCDIVKKIEEVAKEVEETQRVVYRPTGIRRWYGDSKA